jgi:hypothetical protein
MLAVDFTGGGWPVLGIEPFPQGFFRGFASWKRARQPFSTCELSNEPISPEKDTPSGNLT